MQDIFSCISKIGDIGYIFLAAGLKRLHPRMWNTLTASRNSWMTCIHSISLWRELLVRRHMIPYFVYLKYLHSIWFLPQLHINTHHYHCFCKAIQIRNQQQATQTTYANGKGFHIQNAAGKMGHLLLESFRSVSMPT